MTKKNDAPAPYEREMTPGEIAANDAHVAAHARALAEERQRNEIIKQKIAEGSIDPAIQPSQLEVTPGVHAPRAADVFPTNAEQHGGATFVGADEPAPAKPAKK